MLCEISQSEKDIPYDFTHVESNEQTEQTSKTETDSQTDSASESGRGKGMEGLSKKEKGLMDMDNSVVVAGGRWV